MAPPDSRNGDRPSVQYALKTNKRPQLKSSHSHVGHSHSPSHPHRSSKPSSNSMSSPRGPYSVGHAHPPKRSPSTPSASRHQPQGSGSQAASPNYFGMVVDPSPQSQDSAAAAPRENRSPPPSSVRPFGAAMPQHVTLDANPEFEAFRRQADTNRSPTSFSLGSSHLGGHTIGAPSGTATELVQPRPARSQTQGTDTMTEAPIVRFPGGFAAKTRERRDLSGNRMDMDADSNSLHDSAYVSADSERNSEVSLNAPSSSFGCVARHGSPAQFESLFDSRSSLSKVEDRHPRLSLVAGKPETPDFNPNARRAETDPSRADAGSPAMMTPAQLKDLIESVTPQSPASHAHLLLLDLRVSPQYAQSRIRGALNLCLPTTLLKRATFNLVKLQQTFQNEHDQERFARWPSAKYIVVYDAASSEKRDATSAINTLKKFTNESFGGAMYILRGGFTSFASTYPELVAQGPCASTSGAAAAAAVGTLSLSADSGSRRPSVAPVVGGVMLPGAIHNANPFFCNIRQNMDLADGVGQLDVAVPNGLDASGLPRWLRNAAEANDHGKHVSDRFLSIERAEQARMKNAYSIFHPAVATRTPGPGHIQQQQAPDVQLSGLEKGVKNRYKDILPFEHARVRLRGKPEGACDYVNASHIKATRSNKRYIASQGPLPATFEDFWSVIWDHDVRVIVMLTAESEGGQLKCHPYWEARDFGPITLRSLSEKVVSLDIDKHRSSSTAIPSMSATSNSSYARERPSNMNSFPFGNGVAEFGRRRASTVTTLDSSTPTPAQPGLASNSGADSSHGEAPFVIIRKFALSHTAHSLAPVREITHLHYPSWPDFGAPAQPSHLLALVELANVMQRAARPIDVPSAMASAGIDDPSGRRAALRSPVGRGGSVSVSSSTSKTDPIPITWRDEPESDARARPMLVHCSAGCGRTGTFCTVDSVIDMLKRQRLRAVKRANEVLAAREQRMRRESMSSPGRRDADGDVGMDGGVGLAPDERFDFDGGAGRDEDEDEDDVDPISPLSGNPLAALPSPLKPSSAAASSFPRHDSDSSAASYTGTSGVSSHASRKVSSTVGTSGPNSEDGDDHEGEEARGKEADRLDQSFLDDDGVDLIAHTVEDFRTQRLSMVQSLQQFVLCYETVIEWVWRLQERGGSAGPVVAAAEGAGGSSASRSRARSGTFTG